MSEIFKASLIKPPTRVSLTISDYQIDLLDSTLDIGSLNEAVGHLLNEKAVEILWNPSSKDICPSSIAKYFTDLGRDIQLRVNQINVIPEYGLKFPPIPSEPDAYTFTDIAEYVGLVLLGCATEGNDFSSYRLPSDCVEIGKGNVVHCKGFLTQQTIVELITEIRQILNENPLFPWIAMSVVTNSPADAYETKSKLLTITREKIFVL